MHKKSIISIHVIILVVSLFLSVILSAGFYGLSQILLSDKIHTIEETIRYNETRYWAHYIEDIYEYTVKIQASIQNDRDLVHDILSFENSQSIINKVKYKNILNSKIATFAQRLPGIVGTSILTASNSQINTIHNVYIATNSIDNLLDKQQSGPQPLFSSTVMYSQNENEVSYLLLSKYDYRYVTVNLFQDSNFVGCVYLFFTEGSLWGDLYDSGHFRITDEYGNEIINMFEDEYPSYTDDEIQTVRLSNGWEMQKGTQNLYLSPINQKLLIYLGIGILTFMVLSLGISLLLFRKPFSYISSLNEFISSYSPEDRKHRRLRSSKISIRRKLLIFFLLSVIVPSLGLFSFLSVWYSNQVENIVTDKYSTVLHAAARNIDKIIERKKTAFQSLLNDYDFQTYLFDRQKFLEQNNESYINEVMYKYGQLDIEAYDIKIFDYNYNQIFSNTSYTKNEIISDVNNVPYAISVDQFNRRTLSIYLDFGYIYSPKDAYPSRGRIDIPFSELYAHYGNLGASYASIHVTDSEGRILSSNIDNGAEVLRLFNSPQGIIQDDPTKEMIFYSKIGNTPWYLMLVLDWDYISNEISDYINLFISIFIIILLITVLVITILSDIIRKPLLMLSEKLHLHSAFDDTDYVKTDSRIREVIDMTSQFNELLDQLDELYDELLIAADEKNQILIKMHKAEITALQSQINPHYLSNTLENLTSLIIKGSNDKAIEMISLINTQFRVGVSRQSKNIPIREEIIYTKAYIEILRIRFNEDIRFLWDIEDGLLELPIIKLVLQPIIENAVRHGFSGRHNGKRSVTIHAKKRDTDVSITVSDNGCGIDVEKLKIITDRIADNEYYGDHIGFYNVHWRLRLQYGPPYGLTISSELGKGTNVTITFPNESSKNEL